MLQTKVRPDSRWLKENKEIGMTYYYKNKLHLIEEGYQELVNSISKTAHHIIPHYHQRRQ